MAAALSLPVSIMSSVERADDAVATGVYLADLVAVLARGLDHTAGRRHSVDGGYTARLCIKRVLHGTPFGAQGAQNSRSAGSCLGIPRGRDRAGSSSRGGADVVGCHPMRRRRRRMKAYPAGPEGLAGGGRLRRCAAWA